LHWGLESILIQKGSQQKIHKTLLLNGKRIRKEKDRIKEKNRAESKKEERVFWRKWDYAGLDFTNRR
jgi:hypothetical protein